MPAQATSRAPQAPVTVRVFTQRFSATCRGARLARHLAVHRLDLWGFPYGGALSDGAASVVAELTANAVTHGRVPGRDFELRLATLSYAHVDTDAAHPTTLRIEVADTRTEKRPPPPDALVLPPPDRETGRGLLLVAALAARWEVVERVPVGKVVRAELDL
ncbi:ATP-binding protein [Streptomyces platensis]|uniref:ATP-binding protein n=1 Tax=Streptomyces platensis TaxID=58346 RepID=UPI00386ED081|nr:ATP-binding protein [Streptomyces platensis]